METNQKPVKGEVLAQKPSSQNRKIALLFGLLSMSVLLNVFLLLKPSKANSVRTVDQQLSEKIKKKNSSIVDFLGRFYGKYPDLDQRLEKEELQQAIPGGSPRSEYEDKNIWIINTIDKQYLENDEFQSQGTFLPRRSYLVTQNFWKQISGEDLNVECLGGQPVNYGSMPFIVAQLDDFHCPNGSIFLYDVETGENIPVSDPDNLIPASKKWVMHSDGGAGGMLNDINTIHRKESDGEDLWIISTISTSAGYLNHQAFFNALTGELVDFQEFN